MKRIAALELFGALLLVRSLTERKEDPACRTILLLTSDTQGNVYTLLKEAAKKPVTAVIAMEILLHTYLNQVGLAPHQEGLQPIGRRAHPSEFFGDLHLGS